MSQNPSNPASEHQAPAGGRMSILLAIVGPVAMMLALVVLGYLLWPSAGTPTPEQQAAAAQRIARVGQVDVAAPAADAASEATADAAAQAPEAQASAAAEESPPAAEAPPPAEAAPAAATQTVAAAAGKSGEALYKQMCHTCHAAGLAGAPKFGDKAAWAPRIATGMDAIMKVVINGRTAMPPRGATTATDAELRAAVEYMISATQ